MIKPNVLNIVLRAQYETYNICQNIDLVFEQHKLLLNVIEHIGGV